MFILYSTRHAALHLHSYTPFVHIYLVIKYTDIGVRPYLGWLMRDVLANKAQDLTQVKLNIGMGNICSCAYEVSSCPICRDVVYMKGGVPARRSDASADSVRYAEITLKATLRCTLLTPIWKVGYFTLWSA